MIAEEFYDLLGAESQGVRDFVGEIVDFSQGAPYQNPFQSCGLYAVGSRLRGKSKVDIDITLVGLDFRKVFDYGLVHLEDPATLISEGIFVKGESPNPSVQKEIQYHGRPYHYSSENYHDSFSIFDNIWPSGFVSLLFEQLSKKFNRKSETADNDANPFLKYQTAHGDFLGSKSYFDSVDFIVHGENLLVPFWKEHQEKGDLPYVVLHEWRRAGERSLAARRIPKMIDLPRYIDPEGKNRSKILRNNFKA